MKYSNRKKIFIVLGVVALFYGLAQFWLFYSSFSTKIHTQDLGGISLEEAKTTINKNNSISIAIGKDERLFWFRNNEIPIVFKETNYVEIGDILAEQASQVKEQNKFGVRILGTKEGTFKNTVDILDQMEISRIRNFVLEEFSEQELKLFNILLNEK